MSNKFEIIPLNSFFKIALKEVEEILREFRDIDTDEPLEKLRVTLKEWERRIRSIYNEIQEENRSNLISMITGTVIIGALLGSGFLDDELIHSLKQRLAGNMENGRSAEETFLKLFT